MCVLHLKSVLSAGDWRVVVVTGRDDNMATTNTVTLVAYGADDASEPVTLGSGSEGKYFLKGNTDDFKVYALLYPPPPKKKRQ